MAVKSKSELKTEVDNKIYENVNGEVTAPNVNGLLQNIIDSVFDVLSSIQSTLSQTRSYQLTHSTVTAATTIDPSKDVFYLDATGGAFSFQLPLLADIEERPYYFKKSDGTGNAVEIFPNESDDATIEFGEMTSYSMTQYGAYLTLIPDKDRGTIVIFNQGTI
jgi:hypothetical protein